MSLDIGCGTAPKATTRTDIKKQRLNRFIQADAHHLPFKNEAFDTATMNHVIEHLNNPTQAIKEALRVTKKQLTVKTPNLSKSPQPCAKYNAETLRQLLPNAEISETDLRKPNSNLYVELTAKIRKI